MLGRRAASQRPLELTLRLAGPLGIDGDDVLWRLDVTGSLGHMWNPLVEGSHGREEELSRLGKTFFFPAACVKKTQTNKSSSIVCAC